MSARQRRWCWAFSVVVVLLGAGPAHGQRAWQTAQDTLDELIRNSDGATDVQYSMCHISTEDLMATAQATASRVLQGVCNPSEIETRFHNLETQLADQLNVLKTMILNLEDKLGGQEAQLKRQHRRLLGSLMGFLKNNLGGIGGPGVGAGGGGNGAADAAIFEEPNGFSGLGGTFQGESGDWSPREEEVTQYNSTIHNTEGGQKVFTYYWRIADMDYKMTGWGQRRSLRSPSFYVFPEGYRMYLRLYPRQNGENIYVHVGLTKGDFDDSLDWPFKLRHKINVLDQTLENPQDIASRIWDPSKLCSAWNWRRPVSGDNYECVGLGFPHEVVRSRDFLRDDVMVVKLTVYLE